MNQNKFAAILNARQSATADETPAPVAVETVVAVVPVPKPQRKAPKPTSETVAATPPPQGRGKRSDPNFLPTTVYFPRELHNNATIALRVANETRVDAEKEDFSELVTRLLAHWYEKQSYYKPNA